MRVPQREADAAQAEQDAWLAKYSGLSLDEFVRRHDELGRHLTELANPVYEGAFQRGDCVVVGDASAGAWTLPKDFDQELLTSIRMENRSPKDKPVLQISLRETEHPELYALQREKRWMDRREREIERELRSRPVR